MKSILLLSTFLLLGHLSKADSETGELRFQTDSDCEESLSAARKIFSQTKFVMVGKAPEISFTNCADKKFSVTLHVQSASAAKLKSLESIANIQHCNQNGSSGIGRGVASEDSAEPCKTAVQVADAVRLKLNGTLNAKFQKVIEFNRFGAEKLYQQAEVFSGTKKIEVACVDLKYYLECLAKLPPPIPQSKKKLDEMKLQCFHWCE